MNPVRVKFKAESSYLETLLSEYKNSYPKNFSEMVRTGLPLFMIVFSMMLGVNFFVNGSGDESVGFAMVGMVLFVFGIVLYAKFAKIIQKGDNAFVRKKIDTLQNDFKAYPDVKNYAAKCSDELTAAEKHKSKIKTVYYCVFGGFLLLFGCYILWGAAKGFSRFLDTDSGKAVYNKVDFNGYFVCLNLKEDVPLLSVKPLKNEISDGIKLEDGKLDVFLTDFYKEPDGSVCNLSAMKPAISGAENSDKFRLVLTYQDGKPVERCPKFYFDGAKGGIISTGAFCIDMVSKKQNRFQALQTLRYIQANSERLRFLVEKMN
ncbi:MAG: hypothetical protein IIU03_04290 [Bacteroidales bacterium]|nr:hypothetical protein [Bacteroidales bacterium]MBQ5539444.1 hypothetical protein [Bacteroidales bacterium]